MGLFADSPQTWNFYVCICRGREKNELKSVTCGSQWVVQSTGNLKNHWATPAVPSLRLNSVSLSGVNSLICWLPLSTSLPPCLAWSANLQRANARWHFVTRILNSYPQYNLSSHSGAHDIHKSFPVSINFSLILRVVSPDILTNRCLKRVPKVHCHRASQECPQPRL